MNDLQDIIELVRHISRKSLKFSAFIKYICWLALKESAIDNVSENLTNTNDIQMTLHSTLLLF